MKFIRVLFIEIMLKFAFGWTNPVDLFASENSIFINDVYLDSSTKIMHILWNSAGSHSMSYWQIDNSQKLISKSRLTNDNITLVITGKITGANNGNNLYISIMARRFCDQDLSSECHDQYFTESTDNGLTWNPLIQVPRENLDDKCERLGDNLLFVRETGRLFIFYHKICEVSDENDYLFFVTRPAGIRYFNNEKRLFDAMKTIRPSIISTYIFKNNKPAVYIFWGDLANSPQRHILFSQTSDNGQTWSNPQKLGDQIISPKLFAGFNSLNVYANKLVSNTIVGLYAITPPEELHLFYMTEFEKDFTIIKDATLNPQDTLIWDYKTSSMAICGTQKIPAIFILAQTDEDLLEYSIRDLKNMKNVVRGNEPFEENTRIFGAKIMCQFIEDQRVLLTVIAILQGDDGKMHMVATQKYEDLAEIFFKNNSDLVALA